MTLLGYANVAWSGRVSVWVDRSDPAHPRVYVGDVPIGYTDGGLPRGLRPAPHNVTIAAGTVPGVSAETLGHMRRHVEWRDA